MDISCAFATALDTADHVVVAEELGFSRAWLYDSPGIYPDVWMVLARAADRTTRIGLGPAVLVPSLRHPMTNAAAIAALAAWAPGRVAVAIGSGFTGRMVFGHRGMRWADVADYVRVLRALLRGRDAQWEGRTIRMLHHPTCAPPRPIDVPILIAADGPKGAAVAAELGDGVFGAGASPAAGDLSWRAVLTMGTVLDDGEKITSQRATAAIAPGAVVGYHWMYERAGAAMVDGFPGGQRWRESVEAVPADERHLAIHEGHLVAPNERDLPIVNEAVTLIAQIGLVGTAGEVRDRIENLQAGGVTEIAYQPAGPDIPGELERFATAVMG
jgi:5,10-methylenetetrahydromethanopterin reductase